MNESLFKNCRADGKKVISSHWTIEAINDASAERIAEIIRAAYEAGRRDKVDEFLEK